MKTITLQIGNSDNKLTQQEWSKFVNDIDYYLINTMSHYIKVHFSGGSNNSSPFQNFCWVFEKNCIEIEDYVLDTIKKQVSKFAKEIYNQDSIAWTEGVTEFV